MTGRELRAIRDRLGLTQKALAALIGRDAITISRSERGARTITKLEEIAVTQLAEKRS